LAPYEHLHIIDKSNMTNYMFLNVKAKHVTPSIKSASGHTINYNYKFLLDNIIPSRDYNAYKDSYKPHKLVILEKISDFIVDKNINYYPGLYLFLSGHYNMYR